MALLKPIPTIGSPANPSTWQVDWTMRWAWGKLAAKRASEPPVLSEQGFEFENYQTLKKVIDQGGISMSYDQKVYDFTNNKQHLQDAVFIINLEAKGKNQGVHTIKLPFIPKELNYNTESTFAAIKPIARNNAKYHYTGSEDKLEFEIDWHSFNRDRKDVIQNCRMLESWSKGDGYNGVPPTIALQWGNDDRLFRDFTFVLISASYRLVQFNKGQIQDGQVVSTAMLPVQAYQNVVLARVTSLNLLSKEIQLVV